MYRKRAPSLGTEVLQRQMDFELFSSGEAAESKKGVKMASKLQKKEFTRSNEICASGSDDGEIISSTAPESYDLPISKIQMEMPVPGIRVSKTKPHHRRTSSRALDDIAMNPLFELWSEDEERARGSSCPRLGTKNWFEENGVNIGTARSRVEVPGVTNGRAERNGTRHGVLEKKSCTVGKSRQDCSLANGLKNRVAQKSPRNGCVEKPYRNGLTNRVSEKTRSEKPALVQKGHVRSFVTQDKGARKVSAPVPWRILYYLAAILVCSLAVEVITDRGQRGMACGGCIAETQNLAALIDRKQFEMMDRVGSLSILLAKEATENKKLRDELEEAQLFTKYLDMGGRLYVKKQKEDGEHTVNDEVYDDETTIIGRIGHEWHRKLWRLRYHLGTLVRYIRKQLRLPRGSALDDRLRWLESIIVGQVY